MKKILLVCVAFLVSCTSAPKHDDKFLWLEDVEGKDALAWAKARNEETFAEIKSDPTFKKIEPEVRKILLAKDRLPIVSLRAGKLYNFWQDDKNVRGLWRRTTIESYKTADPKWETVLDLDELAKSEKENWVWKGSTCLPPQFRRCLLAFSRGGKDATVVREFDVETKAMVADGFVVPEAKNRYAWIDENTIYVGTDFGKGSMSDSGYPIVSKKWKRGTPLKDAEQVFRGEQKDMSANAHAVITPEGALHFYHRQLTFYTSREWIVDDNGKAIEIPMPLDASFKDVFRGYGIYQLRSDLTAAGHTFIKGSIVALPLEDVHKGKDALNSLELVFAPNEKRFATGVSATRDGLIVSVLDNVKGRILQIGHENGHNWKSRQLELGENGVTGIISADAFESNYLVSYSDFITPASLYLVDPSSSKRPNLLKQEPQRFNGNGLKIEQWETTSKDGTKVPYFIVYKAGTKFDGKAPTLLYGYGGFEIPMTPNYLGARGKVWSERGGVYVLANIRGGGEFGPGWHQAALKENRQRAYDDFIAVAEDLIRRKVTSPRHLGIQGGSNGGLLVGATFTQRPDLFNAVLCEVPLLDMIRFNKLLAGASWTGEYGNPDDLGMRDSILKYSPYQNVKADVKYPEVFFLTSTKDDRVHPGHARKMVARMRDLGKKVFYYENTEGGHAGNANLEQRVLWTSLEATYLWKKLSLR